MRIFKKSNEPPKQAVKSTELTPALERKIEDALETALSYLDDGQSVDVSDPRCLIAVRSEAPSLNHAQSIAQVRRVVAKWQKDHDNQRPHEMPETTEGML